MALRLEQKQAIVAEVNEVAGNALSAVLSDYRGLSVSEMTEIRSKARASGVYLKVIRNSLAKRAVVGTEFECLNEEFVGPSMLAFSHEDPGAAARLLKECCKEYSALEVRALSIGGALLGADQLDRLASLPTRDEGLAILMNVMLAPIVKLARTLNEVPGKLVRTVAAIGTSKEQDG